MASVDVVNVRKSYGATEVIHGVSVNIADGEFVILVGPSGCGKSTLLRMIAGLSRSPRATSRSAIGSSITWRRKTATSPWCFRTMRSIRIRPSPKTWASPSNSGTPPKAEIETRVRRAAEILDVTPYLSRYPRQLSGGQRQRVAMGRAIVRDPQVFLFDEPLSNLDAKLRVQMRAEIKELHQRLKTTTIYVTHDQVEAMTMADRIVVMRDGVVEQAGLPLELYDRPANLFVAGFIGSPAMNLLKGTIRVERQAVLRGRRRGDAAADVGADRLRRSAVHLRNPPRASDARRRRSEGRSVGYRADRLGNAGVRQARHPENRRRVPRARRPPNRARCFHAGAESRALFICSIPQRALGCSRIERRPIGAGLLRYELMLPHQIRTAIEQRWPVVLPLGVLEYHGEHMAVGMDTLAVVENPRNSRRAR